MLFLGRRSLQRQLLETGRANVGNRRVCSQDGDGVVVGALFDLRVVGNLVFLVDDGLSRFAVAIDDVRNLVRNDRRNARGLVVVVTENNERPAIHDARQPLEGWSRQRIDVQDGDAARPKVSQYVVELKHGLLSRDRATPLQRISRRQIHLRGRKIPEHGGANLMGGVDSGTEAVSIDVAHSAKLRMLVRRGSNPRRWISYDGQGRACEPRNA